MTSDIVKLLGVVDQALSMDRHVSSGVSSCNFHIRALRHIRPRLTFDAVKSVAVSIVGARLDYTVTVYFMAPLSATLTVFSVSRTHLPVW